VCWRNLRRRDQGLQAQGTFPRTENRERHALRRGKTRESVGCLLPRQQQRLQHGDPRRCAGQPRRRSQPGLRLPHGRDCAHPEGHRAAVLHQGFAAARCPHKRGVHPASTAATPLQGVRDRHRHPRYDGRPARGSSGHAALEPRAPPRPMPRHGPPPRSARNLLRRQCPPARPRQGCPCRTARP